MTIEIIAGCLHFCGKCGVRIEAGEREFVDNPTDGNHYHQKCPTIVWVPTMGGDRLLPGIAPEPFLSLESVQSACDERLENLRLRAGAWRVYSTKVGMKFVSHYVRDLHEPGRYEAVGWQTVEAFVVKP